MYEHNNCDRNFEKVVVWRMGFEAISLYNKKYYVGQHQKNFGMLRINTCCKNRKNALGKSIAAS